MLSKLQNENLKNHAISDNNNKYVMQVCANEIKPNNEIFTYQKQTKQTNTQIHSELICSKTLMTSSWLPDFSTNTELIMSLSKFGNIFPISNNCSSVGNLRTNHILRKHFSETTTFSRIFWSIFLLLFVLKILNYSMNISSKCHGGKEILWF